MLQRKVVWKMWQRKVTDQLREGKNRATYFRLSIGVIAEKFSARLFSIICPSLMFFIQFACHGSVCWNVKVLFAQNSFVEGGIHPYIVCDTKFISDNICLPYDHC